MVLQRRARSHEMEMEHTQMELRRLSAEHVRAQEEERKAISRELHDEVGQTVTALGIEIGHVERLGKESGPEFFRRVGEARQLAQNVLKSVRGLAMGLRPSMLDDSGLVPALRWQAREFSKHVNVPVDLQIDGSARSATGRCQNLRLPHRARGPEQTVLATPKPEIFELPCTAKRMAFPLPFRTMAWALILWRRPAAWIVGIEERARELGGT